MTLQNTALTILAASTLVFTAGCGESTDTYHHAESEEHTSQNPHADGVYGDMVMLHAAIADSMKVATGDTVYTCPMACVLPQVEGGRCSVCGMTLVGKVAHVLPSDGAPNDETTSHEGHSH